MPSPLAVSCLTIALSLVLVGRAAGGDESPLAQRIAAVIDAPAYKHAHWGILAVDLATGETVFEQNPDHLFAAASTTKLFTVAAALDALGPDHRFETPIYARGELAADGTLAGDLVLVASGDLSLGGRTGPDGRIAFADSDHTYADFSPTAELTAPDPLAGLDELARQVAAAGVRRVGGDVLIDDRLFDHAEGTGSGPSYVTPIMVNDNLIDILVTPGEAGSMATVTWRPETAAWTVDAQVETGPADGPTEIDVSPAGERRIVVRGRIAEKSKPRVRIFAVGDPAAFARTLLIEALARQGVAVESEAASGNAADRLPAPEEYGGMQQVARLSSPPFSEAARLVLKVSHNLHAGALPILAAVKHGDRTLQAGLRRQHDFLVRAGVDVDTISLSSGAGGDRADYLTPRAAVQLLVHMQSRPDFPAFLDALPILGVDGTLATSVKPESPARGQVQAKTGTLVWANAMNGRFLLGSKALAGYLTTASGRRLVFGMFVNNVHLDASTDSPRYGQELGRLCEALYADR